MSLKVEIQWKKFGGGRSEICNWLYLVLYSRPVKKKEKKKSKVTEHYVLTPVC